MIKTKNCAIFGGTFDPIHNGHLHLIAALLKSREFDRLIVVPASDPWQKETQASATDRFAMVKLALSDREFAKDGIEVSDCELKRSGPSYTIDTLSELQVSHPSDRYTIVLGADAFAKIETWHRVSELTSKADFLVIDRPGASAPSLNIEVKWRSLSVDALDISATEIRTRISRGDSVDSLVTTSVARYIKEHRLYGAA